MSLVFPQLVEEVEEQAHPSHTDLAPPAGQPQESSSDQSFLSRLLGLGKLHRRKSKSTQAPAKQRASASSSTSTNWRVSADIMLLKLRFSTSFSRKSSSSHPLAYLQDDRKQETSRSRPATSDVPISQLPQRSPSTKQLGQSPRSDSERADDPAWADFTGIYLAPLDAPIVSKKDRKGKGRAVNRGAADDAKLGNFAGRSLEPRGTSKLPAVIGESTNEFQELGVLRGTLSTASAVENVTTPLVAPVAERSLIQPVADMEQHAFQQPQIELVASRPSPHWILNTFHNDARGCPKFFIAYIDGRNDWHNITVSVRYPTAYATTGIEVDVHSAPSPEKASNVIYALLWDDLDNRLLHDTVTNIVVASDANGMETVDVFEDFEVVSRRMPATVAGSIFGLSRYYESDLCFRKQVVSAEYIVSIGDEHFIYKQAPISSISAAESFLYEFHALYAATTCPRTPSLDGIVFNKSGQHLAGFLTLLPPRQKCLERVIKAAIVFWGRIPWSVRLDWAKQLITAVHAYHSHGIVHGDISLLTVLLNYPYDWIPSTIKYPDLAASDGPPSSTSTVPRPKLTVLLPAPTLDTIPATAPSTSDPRDYIPADFIAPEHRALFDANLLTRSFLTTQSDLYALGMVLWALGMYCGSTNDKEKGSLGLAREEVTSAYKDVVYACLKEDPEERLSTGELLEILHEDAGANDRLSGDDAVELGGRIIKTWQRSESGGRLVVREDDWSRGRLKRRNTS